MLDAFRGGYIPCHLLTKEFNELVTQRRNEGGCFVLNLHSGTKLFDSIMATLHASFDHVDTFVGTGNVIAVAYQGVKKRPQYLNTRSQTLQDGYNFYYDMTEVVGLYRRVEWDTASRIFTDDFAPANYLHAIQYHNRKQW